MISLPRHIGPPITSCIIFLSLLGFVGAAFTTPDINYSRRHLSHLHQSKRQRGARYAAANAEPPKSIETTTIAIVGSGAVGGFYGARLWETGKYDVKFHMRGDNFKESVKNGFNVTSVHGDIFIPADVLQAYEKTEDIGPVDWVVVALKSSSLEAIPDLIYPLLKKETRVLAIMNGLIEDDLIHSLKLRAGEEIDENDCSIQCCAAVYAGMALVCSNRIQPGHVVHSYAGLLSGGVAAFCSERTTESQNQAAFEELWSPTSVDIAYEQSLLRGRWKKNMWNLPFNGISVAMGGITVDRIVNDPGLRRLAYIIMDETVAVANVDLKKHGVDASLYLGEAEKKQMMDLSDGMGPYRTSTMIDLTEKNAMEVKYLFRKPIERAAKLGVPVPHMETLVTQIEAFQRYYKLY
jgi:2-dehydropantoate 2-reductase